MARPTRDDRDRRAIIQVTTIQQDPEYLRLVEELKALPGFREEDGLLLPPFACGTNDDGTRDDRRDRYDRLCEQRGLRWLVTQNFPADQVLIVPTLTTWPPQRQVRDRAALRRLVARSFSPGEEAVEDFSRDRYRALLKEHFTPRTAPPVPASRSRDPRARGRRGRTRWKILPACLAVQAALHPTGRTLPRHARGAVMHGLAQAQRITVHQVRQREKIAEALMTTFGPSSVERLREHAETCQPCARLTRTAGRWCPAGERLVRAMLRDSGQT